MPPLAPSGHEPVSLCGLKFSPVVKREYVLFSSPNISV